MDKDVLLTFSEIGASLATEKDVGRVLETILAGAKGLAGADGATLYRVENQVLVFTAILSDSLGISMSEADVLAASFPPIPLYGDDGVAATDTVAAFAVLNDVTVNIQDAYHAEGFDFSGTRRFDQRTGYRSRSFLTVPIKDAEGRSIAAMQLINAADPITGFSPEHQRLVEALACQAAVAMEKHRLARYENALTGSLLVQGNSGERQLSKADLISELELSRLPPVMAEQLARRILLQLVDSGTVTIREDELNERIIRALEEQGGERVAARYRAWEEFRKSGRPLVILLGGTSGTGKSTVASELALRLDIGHVQSTDMLREVMRLLVSENLVPEIHTSSYAAWRVMDCPPGTDRGEPHMLVGGYRAQAAKVALAIDGILQRTLKERDSAIIEGVHLPPDYHRRFAREDAVIVPVLLAIPDMDVLKGRLRRRGEHAPSRGALHYLEHLEQIRELQDYFIGEAQTYGVPVVPNVRTEQTVRQILAIVTETLTAGVSRPTP